jgi:hypothetical protein
MFLCSVILIIFTAYSHYVPRDEMRYDVCEWQTITDAERNSFDLLKDANPDLLLRVFSFRASRHCHALSFLSTCFETKSRYWAIRTLYFCNFSVFLLRFVTEHVSSQEHSYSILPFSSIFTTANNKMTLTPLGFDRMIMSARVQHNSPWAKLFYSWIINLHCASMTLTTQDLWDFRFSRLWLMALMTETVSTSETSVNFYQTTRRNISEDIHLQHTIFATRKQALWYPNSTPCNITFPFIPSKWYLPFRIFD